MKKITRATIFLLLITSLLMIATGFLTAKPYLLPGINYEVVRLLHTKIIPILLLPLLLFHSLNTVNKIAEKKFGTAKIVRSICFGAIILIYSFFAYALFAKPNDSNEARSENKVDSTTNQDADSAQNKPAECDTSPSEIVLDSSVISKHNKENDCWLYIDGLVYNATDILKYHSGGPDKILPYCGNDATKAFKSRIHSEGAKLLLKRNYIGKLNEKIPASIINK